MAHFFLSDERRELDRRPGVTLKIFWVRGRAIGKGIDFHSFVIRRGTNFQKFCYNMSGLVYSFPKIGMRWGITFSGN